MLCQLCYNVLSTIDLSKPEPWIYTKGLPHHVSTQTVQSSAEEGCYICVSLERLNPDACSSEINHLQNSRSEFSISIYPDYGNSSRLSHPIHVYMNELGLEESALSDSALTETSTGSNNSLNLAKYWFDTCCKEHKSCMHMSSNEYPTRLLDVTKDIVRLIETAVEKPTEPYATLSHCWGSQEFTVLTPKNYRSYVIGRSSADFPASHRDAIYAARRMGFRYLWIDCYCIVQNLESHKLNTDKTHELAKMKTVYANSSLNIGATRASSPYEGCFADRDVFSQQPERFTRPPSENAGTRRFQIDDAKSTAPHERFYRVNGDNHLFRRGWIMQERLLCPRMLHFAGDQIYWECSEAGLRSDRCPFNIQAWPYIVALFSLEAESCPGKPGVWITSSPRDLWQSVVEHYSELQLSQPQEDKLSAISAVAERLAEDDDVYLSGVFQKELIPQLLWQVHLGIQPRQWRAPTWSWAALDGRIEFMRRTRDALIIVQAIEVQRTDPNSPYSSLAQGSCLIIKGRLLRLRLECNERMRHLKLIVEESVTIGSLAGRFFEICRLDTKAAYLSVKSHSFELLPVFGGDFVAPGKKGLRPLESRSRQEGVTKGTLIGLLVQKQSDGTYKRLGLFMGLEKSDKIMELWYAKDAKTIKLV